MTSRPSFWMSVLFAIKQSLRKASSLSISYFTYWTETSEYLHNGNKHDFPPLAPPPNSTASIVALARNILWSFIRNPCIHVCMHALSHHSPSSLSISPTSDSCLMTESPSSSPSSSSSMRRGTPVIVLSSSSSSSPSPLVDDVAGGKDGAAETLLLALRLDVVDEPATDILSCCCCCWLSSALTILPRLTWILYSAFRLVASDTRPSSTAVDTSAYRPRSLSSDDAGDTYSLPRSGAMIFFSSSVWGRLCQHGELRSVNDAQEEKNEKGEGGGEGG